MDHATKKLDLMGQKYGNLTVIAPAENIGNRTAWLCRCSCGRETVVKTKYLRSGRIVNCGCDGSKKGLASLTYVDGTCVEMIRNRTIRSNNTSGVPGVDWLAGKQRWRATICFKGKRRYLGCYEKFEDAVKARKQAEENVFEPFLDVCSGKLSPNELRDIEEACPPLGRDHCTHRLDLTGQRFGKLTVVAPAEKIGAMTAWRCLCDCGKETVVTTGRLRNGQTTSCGCKPNVTLVDGTCVELIQSMVDSDKVRRNNTSGATGVEWVPRTNQWKAVISFKGKRHYLGCYGKFEDAVKARKRAEEELFEPFLREFAQEETQ